MNKRAPWPSLIPALILLPASVMLSWTLATRMEWLLLAILGGVVVCVLAWRLPHVLAAMGSFAVLAGDSFSVFAGIGQVALTAGGALAIAKMAGSKPTSAVSLWLPGALLLWLTVRIAFGSGVEGVRPLLACVGVVALIYNSLQGNRNLCGAIAWTGAGFVLASWALGGMDPTGLRFEGISGNPNRMTFGLLLAIPFVIQVMFKSSSTAMRLGYLTAIALAVRLIFASQSDQGIAGLALLALFLVLYLMRGAGVFGSAAAVTLAVVGILVIVWVQQSGSWGSDEWTLSGRTPLYRAGWQDFLDDPVFGSGRVHISGSLGVQWSAHNSTISIAASAGIVGACLWLSLLALSGVRGVALIVSGHFYGSAAWSVIATQMVQQIEYMPLAWLALAIGIQPSQESGSNGLDPGIQVRKPLIKVVDS